MTGKVLIAFAACLFLAFLLGSYTPWFNHQTDIYKQKQQLIIQENSLTETSKNINYVNDSLTELLKTTPSAARATVAILTSNLNSVPVLVRFSTVASVTRPGHKPAVIANSLPLYQWRDYLPNMLQHKCTFILTKDLTDPDARARLSSFAYAALACPVISANGKIIGNLSISWDNASDVPDQKTIASIKITETDHSVKIGEFLTDELK